MDKIQLKSAIEQAATSLFKHQPNIFEFTSETGQTEWNLAHHLAVELRDFFPSLDHDLDVSKRSSGNRRPDIIFHKRGSHGSNHLVLELKRDGGQREMAEDIEKIHIYWFRPPLCYEFGATVNLRSDRTYEVEILKNPG